MTRTKAAGSRLRIHTERRATAAVAGLPAHQDVEHGGGGQGRRVGEEDEGGAVAEAGHPGQRVGEQRDRREEAQGLADPGAHSPRGRWSRTSRRPSRAARRGRGPPRRRWRDASGPRRSGPGRGSRAPRPGPRRRAGGLRAADSGRRAQAWRTPAQAPGPGPAAGGAGTGRILRGARGLRGLGHPDHRQGPRCVLGQVHRLVEERWMAGHDVAAAAAVLGRGVARRSEAIVSHLTP